MIRGPSFKGTLLHSTWMPFTVYSWLSDSRPEANELATDLDSNPNLAIFRQTDNGVLVRMALFALVLDVAHQVDKYAREVNWYTGQRY